MKQGLSDTEAGALQNQAIQNGSISSVVGTAQSAVEEKQRQIAVAEAKRQQLEAQRAEKKEQQIEALSTPPASLASPYEQIHAYDAIEDLRASRIVTSATPSKPWWVPSFAVEAAKALVRSIPSTGIADSRQEMPTQLLIAQWHLLLWSCNHIVRWIKRKSERRNQYRGRKGGGG